MTTTTIELTEAEQYIMYYMLRRWGAAPIALRLQDIYSEPDWTIAAVKREQRRLVDLFRPAIG
jgi:hypothetical protein